MKGPARWPFVVLAGAGVLALGSCGGAAIGHYTVTGMLPLPPYGSAPNPAMATIADPFPARDTGPGTALASYRGAEADRPVD